MNTVRINVDNFLIQAMPKCADGERFLWKEHMEVSTGSLNRGRLGRKEVPSPARTVVLVGSNDAHPYTARPACPWELRLKAAAVSGKDQLGYHKP